MPFESLTQAALFRLLPPGTPLDLIRNLTGRNLGRRTVLRHDRRHKDIVMTIPNGEEARFSYKFPFLLSFDPETSTLSAYHADDTSAPLLTYKLFSKEL